MFDAFYIGATGMQAQQTGVDTIANNLANVNTNGFKKARISFTDMMAGVTPNATGVQLPQAPESPLGGATSGATTRLGSGVGIASVGKLFDMGTINQTGSAWDIAIQGDGFIQVAMPDGTLAYGRGGTLKVNSERLLTNQAGQPLQPAISVPADATNIAIAADGTVSVQLPNQARPVIVGQMQLVRFTNPSGLSAQGDNIYRVSDTSGEPISGNAGQDGIGAIQQGFLEGSNVRMVDEMVGLMVAQRAYEANVKVVQAADEMMSLVNNLRK